MSNELRADYVLSGSVLRSDGRIRINAKLFDQTDQSCVWVETHTRSQADFIVIQDDKAQYLSRSVMRVLAHAERASLVKDVTPAGKEVMSASRTDNSRGAPHSSKNSQNYRDVVPMSVGENQQKVWRNTLRTPL